MLVEEVDLVDVLLEDALLEWSDDLPDQLVELLFLAHAVVVMMHLRLLLLLIMDHLHLLF